MIINDPHLNEMVSKVPGRLFALTWWSHDDPGWFELGHLATSYK